MKNPLYSFSSNGSLSLAITICFSILFYSGFQAMTLNLESENLGFCNETFEKYSFLTNDCCTDDKPARVNMRYTGESCSATSTTQSSDKWSCTGNPNFDSEVYIIANDNSNPSSGKIWFTGIVPLNGTFVIEAVNGGDTKLASNTWAHIYASQGGALIQTINFHTSCSQPLSTGNQWGSLELLGIEDEHTVLACGTVPPSLNQSCCLEISNKKPAQMFFTYTGESCSATSTTQSSSSWLCSGNPNFDPSVYIIGNNNSNPASGIIWFSGTVALDEVFVLDAANAGETRLENTTYIHIFASQGGALLQTIRFHTSCSQPILSSDQYGAARLEAYIAESGALTCGMIPCNSGFANAGSDQTICAGASTTLCATGGAGFLWSTGATSQCIGVSPGSTTDYTVTVTDANGCEEADGVTVNVTTCTGCSDVLVEYGFGQACDDPNDSFHPVNIASCISNASDLYPYNGSGSASCANGIICIASVYNGWQVDLTAGGMFQVNGISANFLYPVAYGTAGGSSNSSSCPVNFQYEVKFFKNGTLQYTASGSVPKDQFTLETIQIPAPISGNAGDVISIKIDGTTTNTNCDLFEIGGLSVNGCCNPVPPGSCFIAAGTAVLTGGSVSGTEHEMEGAPDGIGVQIWDDGDEVVGQLEGQINSGATYTIRARKRSGASGTATMVVSESFDGSTFVQHPNSSTFSLSSTNWTDIVVTANININFIRFGKGIFGVVDYEVDAVYSSDCGPPMCELPFCWEYDCEDNVDVEVFGVGANNSVPVNINIPDPANIFAVIVEVVYKVSNPGPTIFIQDQNGTNYQANRVTPPGTSSNVWYYRAQLPAGTSLVQYTNAVSQSSLQSVVANVFRQGVGGTATSGIFISQSLFNDTYSFNLSFPASTVDRDVVVSVPLSEVTNDGRVATVIASSGGVTASQTINGSDPALGACCLNIVTLTLPNVPAAETSVAVTVESLPIGGVNPQSLVLAGYVEVETGGCNRPPLAIDDINNTLVDVPVLGNTLTNDSDPDGDNIFVTSINGTPVPVGGVTVTIANGSVTIFPDGSYIYGPNPGFVGIDQFDYEICDDGSPQLCDNATVTIEVISPFDPNNNPPVANNDATQTEENTPVIINVLPNDYDPDGDPLTGPTQTSIPSNGTVSLNPDGTFTYTPNPGFTGKDSFTYEICDPAGLCDEATVTIVVTPDNGMGNDPPVAVDDVSYTPQNTPVAGDASANDYDPDGDSPLAFTQTSTPSNGSVVFNPDGSYVYTPNSGYTGPDQFTYIVCDGISGCDQATVYIVVGPDNDPPVAIDDINNTLMNTPVGGQVITNDYDPNGDNIAVTQVNGTPVVAGGTTVPTPNGSVTINPDGTYTYTPTAGFIGEDTFDYEICDDGTPGPLCSTATVTIEVINPTDPNNNPPVANNDATQTEENTPVIIVVLANDYDPDGDALLGPTQTSNPSNGTVAQNPDGTFTYTPNPGFTGEDSFTYEICDPFGLCDDATVTIVITPDNGQANDPPVAVDDVSYTPQNTPVAGDASANDYDPDGDSPLAFTQTSTPSNGSVVFNPDGSYVYTPNSGYTGPDQFTYEVCDGISGCDQATVYILVGPSNDPPVAINDINNTLIDVPVSGQVLTNDYDPNGDNIIVTAVNGALVPPGGLSIPTLNGSVTINPDGSYTYFPDLGFIGEDEFDYEICDDGIPGPLCTTATVNLTVIAPNDPVNNPPIANNDNTETEQNTPVTINVISNDYDPDGDVLSTPMQTSSPAHGTVVQNPDGTFTYTPNPGFTGEDSFTYQICDPFGLCDAAYVTIIVRPDNGQDNDPPVAVDDVSYTPINTPVSGDASLNDYDPDGDSPLAFTQTSSPSNGMVVFNPDGTYTYTPDNNYTGPDQFTYMVCDGISGCDDATVYIVVGPRNDPPVAIDDDNVTLEDVNVSGNLLTNDYDPNGDNITFSGLEDSNVPGIFIIAPQILPGVDDNGNPVANAGTITPNPDGTYEFDPIPGFTGKVQVGYKICDDGVPGPLCAEAVLTILVIPADIPGNRPPIAINDENVTEENTPVSGTVITNDSDPNGDPLTISGFDDGLGGYASSVTVPEGTFTLTSPGTPDNGDYTFSPAPGFTGTVSIDYEVCDLSGSGECVTATLTILVLPDNGQDNDPPFAGDDFASTFTDVPVSGNWFGNDGDPEGDALSVNGFVFPIDPSGPAVAAALLPTPMGGTVTIFNDGTYTYAPPAGYDGPDQVNYQICETSTAELYCASATIYLLVLPEGNNPPVAINDFNNTLINTPVSGNVTTNDSEPDGDPITVSGFTLVPGSNVFIPSVIIPGQGTITLDDPATGAYTFVPVPGFVGTTDPVEYQICDPFGLCATATVVIEIINGNNPDNKPPVANDDHYKTPFETPVSGQMLPNDFDPDGDPFTITGGANSGTSANGGSWSYLDDGSFDYTPPAGFSGLDVLYTYEICDNTGCDEAVVTVFVNPPADGNQPPNAVDDAYVTYVDISISGQNFRLNDPADPDGDLVSLTNVNGTSMSPFGITVATVNGGTVAIIPDGTFTYIPAPGYSGPDHFVYTVCDGISGCDNATVYITILPVLCIDVQIALWLEGSYKSSIAQMRTDLNSGRSILPGQIPVSPLGVATPAGNPYRGAPWFYDGSGAEENYAGPYANGSGQLVTDWVLISLRSSISKADEFKQVNGLLYEDGHVEFIEPCILFSSDPSEVWIVVEHRNHMGVMSDTAVTVQGGTLLYDFRQTNSYTTSTSFGQKQIQPGVYAMYAGDMDQQADFPGYDINGLDNIVWTLLNGNFDEYLPSDLDMNGDSNGADIILWDINNGISSAVPKN